MTVRVLGLDVGKKGAAAVLERGDGDLLGTKGVRLVDVCDLPFYPSGNKEFLNAPALQKFIAAHHPDQAFIELVNAMPVIAAQGSASPRRGMPAPQAFNFGDVFGSCRTVVHVMGIPMTLVTPQTWKKPFGLRGGAGAKEAARGYCISRLPNVAHLIARRKDEGRAEAILVALYGLMIADRKQGEFHSRWSHDDQASL